MGSSRTRNSNSATRARPSKKPGKDAKERRRRAEAILETARATEPARAADQPYISPTQAVRDGVPTTELRQIRDTLELVCSSAIVVEHALMEGNTGVDDDAAAVLRHHVGGQLYEQILSINRLLGEPTDDEESRS